MTLTGGGGASAATGAITLCTGPTVLSLSSSALVRANVQSHLSASFQCL